MAPTAPKQSPDKKPKLGRTTTQLPEDLLVRKPSLLRGNHCAPFPRRWCIKLATLHRYVSTTNRALAGTVSVAPSGREVDARGAR